MEPGINLFWELIFSWVHFLRFSGETIESWRHRFFQNWRSPELIKFWMNSSSEMRDYYVYSENFTENELIIDHVHESREINELLHESREYFRSRITAIKNRHSRLTKKKPFPTLFDCLKWIVTAESGPWKRDFEKTKGTNSILWPVPAFGWPR